MKIKVKSLQGDEFDLEVQNDQLVSSLKASISENPNGPKFERQKLVYKGRTMLDTNLLSEYNLEEGCKVHLIIQKPSATEQSQSQPTLMANSSCPINQQKADKSSSSENNHKGSIVKSGVPVENGGQLNRFEIILRERLAKHFTPSTVEKILVNLQHEIDSDMNSASLDDLERLAKQKLNISND